MVCYQNVRGCIRDPFPGLRSPVTQEETLEELRQWVLGKTPSTVVHEAGLKFRNSKWFEVLSNKQKTIGVLGVSLDNDNHYVIK